MSVREAAERVRAIQAMSDPCDALAHHAEYMEHASTLVDAYLAEHPADDDEPVDGSFARELGGIRPMAPASDEVYCFGEWKKCEGSGSGFYAVEIRRKPYTKRSRNGAMPWIVSLGGYDLGERTLSRVQLRNLLSALEAK